MKRDKPRERIWSTNIVKPEDVSVDKTYTFTLNPRDEYQYFNVDDHIKRVGEFKQMVRLQFIKWSDSILLDTWVEISKTGRLHVHGTLRFKDMCKFYIKTILDVQGYGMIEIDEMTDKEVWMKYCRKQLSLNLGKIVTPDEVVKLSNNMHFTKSFDDYTTH